MNNKPTLLLDFYKVRAFACQEGFARWCQGLGLTDRYDVAAAQALTPEVRGYPVINVPYLTTDDKVWVVVFLDLIVFPDCSGLDKLPPPTLDQCIDQFDPFRYLRKHYS